MLGCSRKGGGSAKNICIRRISKQKYKENIYYVSLSKKGFTKQKRFHQVKVTGPFLLDKIMTTSITK